MVPTALVVPREAKLGGLKLEMPEKHNGCQVHTISGWLTKIERYFRFMNALADIYIDVVTTWITDGCTSLLGHVIERHLDGQAQPIG